MSRTLSALAIIALLGCVSPTVVIQCPETSPPAPESAWMEGCTPLDQPSDGWICPNSDSVIDPSAPTLPFHWDGVDCASDDCTVPLSSYRFGTTP